MTKKTTLTSGADPAAVVERERKPRGVHPGVAASRARPRATAVGIVYDKTGAPKISSGFIAGLSAPHREWVEGDLRKHGYRINADYTVEKMEDSH